MNKTEKTAADDTVQQNTCSEKRAASTPMRAQFRPNSFIDRGNYDETWSDPMIGNRFLERRKPPLD